MRESDAPSEALIPSPGWLLQCPPGLAPVLEKEMVYAGAMKRGDKLFVRRQRNHDLIFAGRLRDDSSPAKLRTAEMALRCPAYGRFKISKRQLGLLADELSSLGPRRLVVSVAGRVFQRQDLARWLSSEMNERGYEFDPEIEDEVWMFCIDESWYFGFPAFKSREAEGREGRVAERQGSLPPAIAAAIAFAGVPRDDDVVLDPVCGSGTILAECLSYAPGARLVGCDVDPEAVAIASRNLSRAGASVRVLQADSRGLNRAVEMGTGGGVGAGGGVGVGVGVDAGVGGGAKLTAESIVGGVTLTLANLPFGKQFGDRKSNAALYADVLAASLRLRDPARPWRGVFFSSDAESLQQAFATQKQLRTKQLFKATVRGELAWAWLAQG